MKQELEKKIKYYEKSLSNAMDRFLLDNTRKSRDSVIRIKERLNVYNECLSLLNK